MNDCLRPFLNLAPKVLLIFAISLGMSCTAEAAEQLYTCGMHPQIVRKEAGDCPLCNMMLQPVRANSAGNDTENAAAPSMIGLSREREKNAPQTRRDDQGASTKSTSAIHIDSRTIQRMNLKSAWVERGPVRREIRAVGVVTYDEEKLRYITTRYDGWIEKLYVNTSWATVKAGDPLFEIYSPDLYKAQMSYLMATRSEGANPGTQTRSSLNRLQLYDLSAEAIADLIRGGEAHPSFTYRAPSGGTIIEKTAVVGQMIKSGEPIYRIADLTTVWVLAQIYENDLPFVRPDQEANVKVTYGLERTVPAHIALLLPQIDEHTRTATARLAVPNTEGTLRPGMFVDVRFTTEIEPSAVLVPDVAVFRSGEHNTVFVALEGGAFEPREIQLGVRSEGNFYQVLRGLAAGERVVTSGQFMLDSESQLREAIEKMLASSPDPSVEPRPMARANPLFSKNHASVSMATAETCGSPGLNSIPGPSVSLQYIPGQDAEIR